MSANSRAVKLLKIAEYENLALKTSIHSLNYNMQLIVRLKNPQTLEEAMSFAMEKENFICYKNRNNSEFKTAVHSQPKQNNSQVHYTTNASRYQPSPLPRNTVQYPFNRSNFNTMPANNRYNAGYNNFQNVRPQTFNQNLQHFPNNVSNPFQRPMSNVSRNNAQFRSNFNNNFRPSFGNSSVFRRPNVSNVSRLPKPEPMDTSSGNTFIY